MSDERFEKLLHIIKEAGKIIKGAHMESADLISEKEGSANFVTVYDVRVQEFLKSEIKVIYPEAVFMSEEQENDASVLKSECCFIIDPIDGTTNFIRENKHSCISVAMLTDGCVVKGAVYDPYLDEMFTAEKGKGAFVNGRPIKASQTQLDKAICGYGTSPYYRDTLGDKTFAIAKELFTSCADLRRCGSAALDLSYIAAGRYDIFFECKLSPWDYAAGVLLIEEAGGVISDMQGKALVFDAPCSVIAANAKLYPTVLNVAKEK